MTAKLRSPNERLRELADLAIARSRNNADAYDLWQEWVLADAALTQFILDEAVRTRGVSEISAAQRRHREVLRSQELDEGVVRSRVPSRSFRLTKEVGDAAVRSSILTWGLPNSTGTQLQYATCRDAWEALSFYRSKIQPFAVEARWYEKLLAGRPASDNFLLPRNKRRAEEIAQRARDEAEREVA